MAKLTAGQLAFFGPLGSPRSGAARPGMFGRSNQPGNT